MYILIYVNIYIYIIYGYINIVNIIKYKYNIYVIGSIVIRPR